MRRGEEILIVDPTACDAHGVCAELLPELIHLDPWGYPIIDDQAISPDLISHARRAVSSCPRLALRLVDATTVPARHRPAH